MAPPGKTICARGSQGVPEPQVPSHSGTCGLEDARVAETVSGGKSLHHAVDLLGLARQPEAPQELSGGGMGLWAMGWVGISGRGVGGTSDKLLCLSKPQSLYPVKGSRLPWSSRVMGWGCLFFPSIRAVGSAPSARVGPRTICGPSASAQEGLCLPWNWLGTRPQAPSPGWASRSRGGHSPHIACWVSHRPQGGGIPRTAQEGVKE